MNCELKIQFDIQFLTICSWSWSNIQGNFLFEVFPFPPEWVVSLQKSWVCSVNSNEIHSIVSNNLTLLSLKQFSLFIFFVWNGNGISSLDLLSSFFKLIFDVRWVEYGWLLMLRFQWKLNFSQFFFRFHLQFLTNRFDFIAVCCNQTETKCTEIRNVWIELKIWSNTCMASNETR